MAKSKQPSGQPMGKKMAIALKKRCDALEDCVVSQQATIKERESEIVNMRLAYDLAKRRYDEAMQYLQLNRPEILQLMKVSAKHGALAAAGKAPSVTVKLVKRKLKAPKIPEAPAVLSQDDIAILHREKEEHTVQEAFIARSAIPPGPPGPDERYDFKTKKFVAISQGEES